MGRVLTMQSIDTGRGAPLFSQVSGWGIGPKSGSGGVSNPQRNPIRPGCFKGKRGGDTPGTVPTGLKAFDKPTFEE
jgi:hypothetical protein